VQINLSMQKFGSGHSHMQKWIVYILRCSDTSLYIGITNDLDKRIARHNSGDGARYTRSRRPVFLVWKEYVNSESLARKRELQLKGWTKIKKENLIKFGYPLRK